MLHSERPLVLFDCVSVSLWREYFVFPGTGELFGYIHFVRVKNAFCFQNGYEGVFSFSPDGLFFFWSTLLRACSGISRRLPPVRCGDSKIPCGTAVTSAGSRCLTQESVPVLFCSGSGAHFYWAQNGLRTDYGLIINYGAKTANGSLA